MRVGETGRRRPLNQNPDLPTDFPYLFHSYHSVDSDMERIFKILMKIFDLNKQKIHEVTARELRVNGHAEFVVCNN